MGVQAVTWALAWRVRPWLRESWRPLVVLALALLAGLGGPELVAEHASARYPVTAADLASGRAALADLVVAPRTGAESYEREEFGAAWDDVDGNGCDTRDDVLRRDLLGPRLDVDGCTVLAGVLDDPYTGARIEFARGPDSADVQIDHVVALADAWASGARTWDPALRRAFANDPANLLAVDGPANQDKGAADADAWLPPDQGYACVYALLQVRVKSAYGLRVTPDERAALEDALSTCVTV
ncbi:DUF1524 domain-containing protein [Cellulomonas sp. DKR-3]|uniref:DUF1524 domain-containing protein n=1 Tax=Cellulomonas fulva TaxID=2835530 RepID=A0ABS5TW93_9CELL|nr:DUF1524 domain-containing protein [Cellulomonas fulva]